MQKKFIYKIYNTTDVFVTVLNDVISEPSFSYSINGGLGEIILRLDRNLNSYGEGSDLDFNYRLKIYETDDNNDSLLIYSGYLTAFNPFLIQGEEGVDVTFLPNLAKLGNDFFRSGTSVKDNFEITKTTTSVEQVMQDIVDNYIASVTTSMISNDYSNMDATGVNLTNTFRNQKHIEAIRETATFMAYNWYWYIDVEGKLHLKAKDATATHSLFLRKQIKEIETSKDIESTINTYFLWNSQKEGTVVDNNYIDATSVTAYDTISDLILNGDVVSDTMSDLIGNSRMNANKDVKRKIKIVVTSEECNLESFKPGDTVKVMDIAVTQTIFGTNMQITRIDYKGDRATLELVNTDAAFIKLSQQEVIRHTSISTIEEVAARVETGLNSSANLITDVINARLDSESKYILSDFNFGTTNYAGAVKSGDIAWNTTTGAITSGSGVVVYRGGIVGANAGDTTFSISAVTGDAYFAGELASTSGLIGGWKIGATTLKSTDEFIELDSANNHIKIFSEGSTNLTDYAQLSGSEDPNQVNVGIPRFDVYRDVTETDGNVRTQYGKVLWFYTKYQTVAYDPCPQTQMWTKDGKEYNEEFGGGIPNDKDGISTWALHMKSTGDASRLVKAQIQFYADSTVSGNYKGEITLVASAIAPGVSTCRLGDYNSKWSQLYLDQLASNPSAPYLVEGLIFTKTDHHIYYYNGTSAIALDGGISEVKDDTSPELGGGLDCNGNNLTEVGGIFPDANQSLGGQAYKWEHFHAKHIYSTALNEFLDLTNIDPGIKQNLICYTDVGKNLGDSTHRFASVFGRYMRCDSVRNNAGSLYLQFTTANIDCYAPLILNELAGDPTPARGMIYYNTSVNKIKVYNGSSWETVTSA